MVQIEQAMGRTPGRDRRGVANLTQKPTTSRPTPDLPRLNHLGNTINLKSPERVRCVSVMIRYQRI